MGNNFQLKILPKPQDVCSEAANIFASLLSTNGKNNFIVPGGKTPKFFYRFIGERVSDLTDITMLLSDDRLVKEESKESNIGMLKNNLLKNIQHDNLPRVVSIFEWGKGGRPTKIINSYAHSLCPFKAAFLGVGKDGHTASLFPGLITDTNSDSFIFVKRQEEVFERVSVSFQTLTEIPYLVFMVTGAQKKNVLKDIVNGNKKIPQLVIQKVINNAKDHVLIICDQDAASDL